MTLLDPTLPRAMRLEHAETWLAAEMIDGSGPAIVFLSGYQSTMTGNKAQFLSDQCAIWSWKYIRFDYRGRGISGGEPGYQTLTRHLEDAIAVLDQLAPDQQVILIGSSMGGWLGLRLAELYPSRIAGFLGIAAAPDFTTYLRPEDYGLESHQVPQHFIADAAAHLMHGRTITYPGTVELLQGMQDSEVPVEKALATVAALATPQVRLTFVKDGDHSLSRPQDLTLLWQALTRLREQVIG